MFAKRHCSTFALAASLTLGLAPHAAGAADVIATHRLGAALANDLVVAAVAACDKMGYQTTAVVTDIDGVDQAVLRGDGAGVHTQGSAHDKAYSSATFGLDTITMVERAKTGLGPIPMFAKLPNLLLADGGLVIKWKDEVIGGIGVAGSPGKDTDCARAALDKLRDRIK
jgi:uncharacterized protein GlcG (DUF336 family)